MRTARSMRRARVQYNRARRWIRGMGYEPMLLLSQSVDAARLLVALGFHRRRGPETVPPTEDKVWR